MALAPDPESGLLFFVPAESWKPASIRAGGKKGGQKKGATTSKRGNGAEAQPLPGREGWGWGGETTNNNKQPSR